MHDFGGELFVEEGSVHGEEGFVAAVLDGAFAVAVDEDGALFRLFGGMAADVDQGFDDIVEGVDIVVPQHKAASVVFQNRGLIVRLGAYIWFVLFHFFLSRIS